MKQNENTKYVKLGITGAAVLAFGFAIMYILNQSKNIAAGIQLVFNILKPFLYGALIAYLLAPICNRMDERFLKWFPKATEKQKKGLKFLSIAIAVICAVTIVVLLILLILPQVWDSTVKIIKILPARLAYCNRMIDQLLKDQPELQTYFNHFSSQVENGLNDVLKANSSMMTTIQGIVNNITTEMALEAGELILKHEDLQNIMDTIIEHHVTKKSFVPSKQKPKAILLCCTTGLGTTDKMKMLLQGCLEGIDIDVVEMTYAELSTEGNRCDVFRKYDIQFIITTSKLMIQGVTTLMLNELIDERGEKVIYSTVGRYCDKDKTQRFIENIVRSFTIKNLIGQLTILNPDKIMGDVEETVSKLEILEDTTYSIDQKKMLYIHMCVMVERLILEKGRLPQEDMTDDLKCRESFIKNLKESFSVIENKYNVSLNEREILMIYYLTENN